MKKLLSWLFMPLFGSLFFLLLCFFHIVQLVALHLGGYTAHKNSVDILMWCLNRALLLVGMPIQVKNEAGKLPTNRPMIIVSNHQSMFDIPTIGVAMRRHHPKYVSKKALGKGIPSISYNLRHGGSVLIDRNEKEESLLKIKAFCAYLKMNNYAGCIFPEGTRSKTGMPKDFKKGGLLLMLEELPDAIIVPIALQNYWKIGRYYMKPIPFGARLRCAILPPVERADRSAEAVLEEVEARIKERVLAMT